MMTRNYTRAKAHFFKNLDMGHLCEPEDPNTSNMFTGTKVVGTIGPATQGVENLVELLEAGMAGARIDLTWGPVDFHRKSLSNLKVRHAFLAMKQATQTAGSQDCSSAYPDGELQLCSSPFILHAARAASPSMLLHGLCKKKLPCHTGFHAVNKTHLLHHH